MNMSCCRGATNFLINFLNEVLIGDGSSPCIEKMYHLEFKKLLTRDIQMS